MPVPQPQRFRVFEFVRRMNAGMTAPLLCGASFPDGTPTRIVLKLRNPEGTQGHFGPTSLAAELMMATLARLLGLRVPEYGVAEVGPVFAMGVSDSTVSGLLSRNIGLNFATVLVPGTMTWDPRHRSASPLLSQAIDNVMSFDASVINGDRRRGNPNLLWDGGEQVQPIDHGLACIAHMWDDSMIVASPLLEDQHIEAHSGFDFLQGRGAAFSALHSVWNSRMSTADWTDLGSLIPPEWERRGGDIERMVQFLSRRASRFNEVAAGLRRVTG